MQCNVRNSFFALAFFALVAAPMAASFNLTDAYVVSGTNFGVKDLLQVPDRIYPGDEVRLRFYVFSDGFSMSNAQLTIISPFSSAKSLQNIGALASGVPKSVVVDLSVPNATKPGKYYAFVYMVDQMGYMVEMCEIPIIVNEPVLSNALIAHMDAPSAVYAGDTVFIPVTVENVGGISAESVVVQLQTTSASAIVPLGSDRLFIRNISAGANVSTGFEVAVSAGATPGIYLVSLNTTYKADKVAQPQVSQTVGIPVRSKANLLVTPDANPKTASATANTNMVLTIANTGDADVRGVYASAASEDFSFSGASDAFIGTLNLDDSSTMSLTLVPKGRVTAGNHYIALTVTYKDALNAEHTQVENLTVSVVGAGATGAEAATGGSQAFAAGASGRRSAPGFGLSNPLFLAVAAIVLAVAGFFGYRWYKGRKK